MEVNIRNGKRDQAQNENEANEPRTKKVFLTTSPIRNKINVLFSLLFINEKLQQTDGEELTDRREFSHLIPLVIHSCIGENVAGLWEEDFGLAYSVQWEFESTRAVDDPPGVPKHPMDVWKNSDFVISTLFFLNSSFLVNKMYVNVVFLNFNMFFRRMLNNYGCFRSSISNRPRVRTSAHIAGVNASKLQISLIKWFLDSFLVHQDKEAQKHRAKETTTMEWK